MCAMSGKDDLGCEEMQGVVAHALASVAPDLGQVDADTCLVGDKAVLDSLGFVTFLVCLEQSVGQGIDLSSLFLELGAAESAENPFFTVGSLALFIQRSLASQP